MVRVTVVLPTYNEEDDVASALEGIDEQGFKDRELVVVDDGSEDRTFEVASKSIEGRSLARIIRTEHGGPARARNIGAREAIGDILFFTESDCTYSQDYLQKAVEKLDSEPESSAVCLTGAPLMTRSTLATECIEIENKVQHRLLNEGKIKPFYAWVFRREAFLDVGGFDERLFQGEDKDLFRRFEGAGYGVAWVPGVHWWHRRNQTTWSLARKWFVRGRSRVLYSLKHRLVLDLAKALLPLLTVAAGLLALTLNTLVGSFLLLVVGVAILAHSFRIMAISWRDSNRHLAYLGYPFFVLIRNFSTGLGYLVGILGIFLRRRPVPN